MAQSPMKIFFFAMDGVGHINACVGLAQALAKRGHHIYFLTNAMFSGSYKKFGFDEICLKSQVKNEQMKQVDGKKPAHPLAAIKKMLQEFRESGMLSGKPSIKKLREFDPEKKDSFGHKMYEELNQVHQQIVDILDKEKPDFIIVDHFLVAPCIAFGKIPWAYLFSGGPLFLYKSDDLSPPFSGYPTNDRTGWDEFRKAFKNTFIKSIRYYQDKINNDFGYPETPGDYLFLSPHMIIYGYPEELDYHDIVKRPDSMVHLDAFCRETPEPFELPEEFKMKIKPDDKLVYVSMGSMASIDVDLMKRITTVLGNSPHKFIVSKGPAHEEYELPDNMWGQAFLPQVKVLPLVDMVITHGGNNTVTESFSFGKPMLVMPLFGDQYDNSQRIMEKGYGYRLDAYLFKDDELIQTVDKILNDEEMIKRSKQAAERMRTSDSKMKACIKIEQMVPEIKKKLQG